MKKIIHRRTLLLHATSGKVGIMRVRLVAYENSQSNWESFKREFNHDMDEIGQALKDLTVDNKK